jgi:sterol desaturase/sphingolipid hydroxylase (fatty acid hydroxylase superfamily)
MSPASESTIRIGCFLAVLMLMAAWEIRAPRRALTAGKPFRWASNLGLIFLNTAVLRIVIPITAVALATLAAANGWGLLNQVELPGWLETAAAVIALDLVIYLQHVMFHAVPALWRLHMVHHADLDFDVTTGLRFHTLEIILSMLIKLAAVLVLGPSALAVLVFEVLLNATSMFNHGNVRLTGRIDRLLRCFVVTPDMHRVHHSVAVRETNSNFGFNLPWWDYLLGTYRAQPVAGHQEMTIGIAHHRDEHRVDRLPGMLLLPFAGAVGDYPINRRGPSDGKRVEASERPS